jgi:hypothetical protein
MGATLEFDQADGVRARVDGGEWTCADPRALDLLQLVSGTFEPEVGNYIPDYDLALADYVIRRFGGRIVEQDPPPPAPTDGRIE